MIKMNVWREDAVDRDFQAAESLFPEPREPEAEPPPAGEPEAPVMLTDAMCGMACEVKRQGPPA